MYSYNTFHFVQKKQIDFCFMFNNNYWKDWGMWCRRTTAPLVYAEVGGWFVLAVLQSPLSLWAQSPCSNRPSLGTWRPHASAGTCWWKYDAMPGQNAGLWGWEGKVPESVCFPISWVSFWLVVQANGVLRYVVYSALKNSVTFKSRHVK